MLRTLFYPLMPKFSFVNHNEQSYHINLQKTRRDCPHPSSKKTEGIIKTATIHPSPSKTEECLNKAEVGTLTS